MRPTETFLIVSLRYIGDVLLSTVLSRSIRAAFPDATVDFLVFRGTEIVLEGNPDVRRVITVVPGSRRIDDLAAGWGKYDVAIGANASDRTAFQAIARGKRSIGFVDPRPKEWWKKIAYTHYSTYDPSLHVVESLLSRLRFPGIPPIPEVCVPFTGPDLDAARTAAGPGDFVLLHPYTRWEYKKWPSERWVEICRRIEDEKGIRALFTVAPGDMERRIELEIRKGGIAEDRFLLAPLTFGQLAALISQASVYVGVDTVVTHMAAALGRRTVAIFGPTPPWRWGPWPNGHTGANPYPRRGGIQRQGDIVIVQKDWDCAACDRMGCEHRRDSGSRCLVELSVEEVFGETSRLIGSNRM